VSFEFREAKREDTRLLIGLAGGTGAGKTESAMRLATGLAGGKRFAVIDTENGRALHKADDYQFDHGDLTAPFTPERYLEAIQAADAAGYPVIVVDSLSHEYEGVGGILEIQEQEFDRMERRESARMSSWILPKRRHKVFVNQLLQVRAHVIVCMRAEDKIEIVKDGGKTVVRPKQSLTGADGWIPICEKRFPFELTLSLLLTADQPGVPKPIKLEERHRAMVLLDQPLSEETGRLLGEWAAGHTGDGIEALEARLFALADRAGKTAEVEKAIGIARKPEWYRRQIKRLEQSLAGGESVASDAPGDGPDSSHQEAGTPTNSPPASDDEPHPDPDSQFQIPVGARQVDQG
jgi:hypothetical protein